MKDKSELCECDDLETRVEIIEKWMGKYAVFVADLCSIVKTQMEKEKVNNFHDLDIAQDEIENV